MGKAQRNPSPAPVIPTPDGTASHGLTNRAPPAIFWLGLTLAALLLFSRAPGHLLAPELWAEDGRAWVRDAYVHGWPSLFRPLAGYLQTVARLSGLLAVRLPFTAIPLFFALIAFAAQLAPAALLLSWRGAGLIPSLPARLLLVAYLIGLPNSAEVYVNLTNTMWHLAIASFLIAVLPKPRGRAGMAADVAVLLLSGLSGPLVLFNAPIAWWHAWEHRGQSRAAARRMYAAALTAGAVVQAAVVLSHTAKRFHGGPLGVTLNRLFHILADQVVLGGTIGGRAVSRLLAQHWWLHTLPPALVCLAAAALGLLAFAKGPSAYRQLVVLAALVLAGGLRSPIVSQTLPQWELMQYPTIGTRYYIIAMLAWFTTLLVLAARPWGLAGHWLARGLLCACLIGVVADWRDPPYGPTAYQTAARTFDEAAPGTVVTFPENPLPWTFELTKR